jgi:transcriptional regulator with XRE-family HTH domain
MLALHNVIMSPARPNEAAMSPEQFRELCEASGLSQQEVADMLGVDRITVWRWANGKTPIGRMQATAIRAAFKTL